MRAEITVTWARTPSIQRSLYTMYQSQSQSLVSEGGGTAVAVAEAARVAHAHSACMCPLRPRTRPKYMCSQVTTTTLALALAIGLLITGAGCRHRPCFVVVLELRHTPRMWITGQALTLCNDQHRDLLEAANVAAPGDQGVHA